MFPGPISDLPSLSLEACGSCRDQEGRTGSDEAVLGPRCSLEGTRRVGVRRQGSQVSMRVARGSASWLSSHGRGLGPRDALKKPGESGSGKVNVSQEEILVIQEPWRS